MTRSTERLSLRHSILVWVSGIVVGWGCAVVLVYHLLRTADEANPASAPIVAQSDLSEQELMDIAPAAGPQFQP